MILKLPDMRKLKLPDVAWSELGAIGRSPAVRLTILVPVLGYMLLLNYGFLEFMQLVSAQTWAPNTSPDVAPPMKLIFTYLGLCSLGLASGIFVLICPRGPKDYTSETEFLTAIGDIGDPGVDFQRFIVVAQWFYKLPPVFHEDQFAVMRAFTLLETVAKSMTERGHRPVGFSGAALAAAMSGEMPFSIIGELKSPLAAERIGVAGAWFAVVDRKKPVIRQVVWTFYAIGFCLLAVPTLWTVFEVIWQIVRRVLHLS